MGIEVRKKGKVSIFDFHGELAVGRGDGLLQRKFKERLGTGERLFIFNMIEIPFMDSVGLGETVACVKRAYEKDGAVKFVIAPEGKVDQIFRITRLHGAFDIFADEEEAIASFIP